MTSQEGEKTLLEKYLEEIKAIRCNGSCDNKATQDEVKQLKEQLKSLKAELASLKQILGLKNVLLGGLFSHPFTDSGYSDAIAETSSYSSSYVSSTTPKSVYSTCSCGSQQTSASSSSDFCSRPDDLSQMSGPLTEESILKVLHQRWKFGECQTRVGPVLITFNPHRGIPIQQAFQYSQLGQNLPLSQLATNVVNNLHDNGSSQAIILFGESGSGKTYTSQLLLRQIYDLKGEGSDSESFKLVTAASHVLRALSSVTTPSNPSTTRMGCITEVGISTKGLDRVRFHPLWMDQCRVVGQLSDESNFHILKQMVVGLTPEEKAKLHLKGCTSSNLRCLSASASDDVDYLRIQFECFRSALYNLGIEFMDVMRVLSAVLLLRNLEFQDNGGYELDMNGNEEIKFVSSLLGISGVSLYHALTSRTHVHKDQAIKTLCDAKKANLNAASLAKALYCRTVLAVVKRINSVCRFEHQYAILTAPGEECGITNCTSCSSLLPIGSPTPSVSSYASHTTSTATLTAAQVTQTIQILDMPGFQTSANNRLGQLLSNISSERLQQFYNMSVLESSLKACSEARIQCDVTVTYQDNSALVDLLYHQDTGLLGRLDQACLQRLSDAKSFLQTLSSGSESDSLKPGKTESFIVNHSNGPVEYKASDFIWTNRDVIGDEIVGLFTRKSCNFGFATHLFIPELRVLKRTRSPGLLFRICPPPPSENTEFASENVSSFGSDFRQRVEGILETFQEADRHYIFCVKTNDKQSANQFEMEVVQRQVRASQIVPTVHLMAAGYPHHMTFGAFSKQFGCLAAMAPSVGKEKEHCTAILENLLTKMNESKMPYITTRWSFGSSHVFLSDETLRFLKHFLSHRRHNAAIVIQSYVRRWICMQWWKAQQPPVAKKKKAKKHVQIREPVYESIPVTPSPMEEGERSLVPEDPDYMEASPVVMTSEMVNLSTAALPLFGKGPPPPLPRNHPCQDLEVTSTAQFPQTRLMKCDYPMNDPLLKAGEAVLVTGQVKGQDMFYVEHTSCLLRIPGELVDVKTKGTVLGTKL